MQNKLYRYEIEMQPLFKCQCCYTFLFNEQVQFITKETNASRKAKVCVHDEVCNYCLTKLKKMICHVSVFMEIIFILEKYQNA